MCVYAYVQENVTVGLSYLVLQCFENWSAQNVAVTIPCRDLVCESSVLKYEL